MCVIGREEEILTVGNPGRNEILVENACRCIASTNSLHDVRQFALILLHYRLCLRLNEVHFLTVSQRVLNNHTNISVLYLPKLITFTFMLNLTTLTYDHNANEYRFVCKAQTPLFRFVADLDFYNKSTTICITNQNKCSLSLSIRQNTDERLPLASTTSLEETEHSLSPLFRFLLFLVIWIQNSQFYTVREF